MMQLMGMVGSIGTLVLVLPFLLMGIAVPLIIYLVARWRNEQAPGERQDSQIGLKVALYLLQIVGFQIGLLAIFLFLLAVISELPTGDFIRIAIGLGLPAAGLYFVHKNLSAKTNTETFPAVRRMFQGWNMLMTALPGFASFMVFSVLIFADLPMDKGDIFKIVLPYLLTYGGAWVFLSVKWFRSEGLLPQPPPAGSNPQGGYQQPGAHPQGGYQQQPGAQAQGGYQQPQAGYQQPQAGYQQPGAQPQGGYPPQSGGGGYPPQGG